MDIALRAAEKIMNDDIKGAEEGLKTGDSAFHKLAKGTLGFMKATLGFEQDVMREASDLLYEAETSAYNHYQQAQKDHSAYQSQIYDRGTEFLLCQAEAQIMSAIVGVLNESVTESLKGFYKMRKAYMILEQIMQMEHNYAKMNNVQSLNGSRVPSRTTSRSSLKSIQSLSMGTPALPTVVEPPQPRSHPVQPSSLRNATMADSDDDEFYDAAETEKDRLRNGGPATHVETPGSESDLEKSMQHLNVKTPTRPGLGSRTSTANSRHGLIDLDAKSEVFQNGLDVFIHSGTNLMFGIISLMLGVVPPTFSKILSIVGFRGDREKGMLMLWQASKFRNINGGMAALMLFGWYNGMTNFCDIYSDPDPELDALDQYEGYPIQRLEALLEEMRGRYPDSQLWQIEEARMAAARRDTDGALRLLSGSTTSDMKQLQALKMFEQSLNAQFSHKYDLTAQSYLQCVELNGWSQALYYYVTGAAYLHMSRDLRKNGTMAADVDKYEKLAEEYFRKAPTMVGKKKMMGRQLPFDSLVQRKINKWDANAKAWNCPFIEAVGVAPIEEMIYLWNGYKKMSEPYLRKSLLNLEYTERSAHFSKFGTDEKALLALLRASVYRNLGEHKKAQAILEENVFCHPKTAFTGQYMDTWAAPSSYYEHAVNSWQQRSDYIQRSGSAVTGSSGHTGHVRQSDRQTDVALVADAKRHVEIAKSWGAYELDARIGMKMTAALGAIGKWEKRNGVL